MTDKDNLDEECKSFLNLLLSKGDGLNGSGIPINELHNQEYLKFLGITKQKFEELKDYSLSYGYTERPNFKSTGFIIPPPSGSEISTFIKITKRGIDHLDPKKNIKSSNITIGGDGQVSIGNNVNMNQNMNKNIQSSS